jgi:hypothetical protein
VVDISVDNKAGSVNASGHKAARQQLKSIQVHAHRYQPMHAIRHRSSDLLLVPFRSYRGTQHPAFWMYARAATQVYLKYRRLQSLHEILADLWLTLR